MKNECKWEVNACFSNVILNRDGFYISFNPYPAESDVSETALYYKGIFYILDGDWRLEYEKVAHDINKCLELFYELREDFESFWSWAPKSLSSKENK